MAPKAALRDSGSSRNRSTNELQEMSRFSFSSDAGTVVDALDHHREAVEKSMITDAVMKHVFPYKKFIILEKELDYGQNLQRRVCYKLNRKGDDHQKFWARVKEQVRKNLGRKRNNVMENIKKKMIGKPS